MSVVHGGKYSIVGLDFISVTVVLQLVNYTDFKRIAADCY